MNSSLRVEVGIWAFVAAVFGGSLLALGCSEPPTSTVDLPALVPFAQMIGSDSCNSKEWVEENGHVKATETQLVYPSTCWEYSKSSQVYVEIDYAFKPEHPDTGWMWHTLRHYVLDNNCEPVIPMPGATFDVLDSIRLYEDTTTQTLSGTITLPASPECAFVTLQAANTPRGGSDHFAYVRILTMLDNDPPDDLDGSFDGTSVNLTWAKDIDASELK